MGDKTTSMNQSVDDGSGVKVAFGVNMFMPSAIVASMLAMEITDTIEDNSIMSEFGIKPDGSGAPSIFIGYCPNCVFPYSINLIGYAA